MLPDSAVERYQLMEARYFQLLDQLADFGEDLCRSRIAPDTWHEYLQSGFNQSHVPDLIRILDDDTLHESEFTGTAMAPIHAWRILAELKAVEAIPALISLIHRIDDNDWIGEEFPMSYEKIFILIQQGVCHLRAGDDPQCHSIRLTIDRSFEPVSTA